jgi:aspartyl/asparaginyl beta-hydroxylase (cupin superfamily)
MQLTVAEAERLARNGAQALGAGRPADARRDFEQIAASGRANAQIWLLLAHVRGLLGDHQAAEAAADEVLKRDAANLRAMIIKGDARIAAGDERAGISFYKTAAAGAAEIPGLPADLKSEIDRAERTAIALTERFRGRLEEYLRSAGVSDASPRFRESMEILAGQKQVYFQQPTAYFFPRLPQIQFYEPEQFDWAGSIEAAAADIRAELVAALEEGSVFRPYLQARADRPAYDFHGLLDNPDWSTLYLWENGGPVATHTPHFPKTMEALREVPLPRITTRAPSILFSLLKRGARIAPHHGMINTRLICHLPLVVPSNCGFRCGNEVREWEPGKLLIFDDTIEHEAWNDSEEDRVILIFDIWRPELTSDERKAVSAIFEAIDEPAQAPSPEPSA